MAEDGRLQFNTALDNTGFNRDSEKLIQNMLRLEQTMNKIGGGMGEAIEGAIPSIDKLEEAFKSIDPDKLMDISVFQKYADALTAQMAALVDQADKTGAKVAEGFETDADVDKTNASIQQMIELLNVVEQRMGALSTVGITSQELEADGKRLDDLIDRIAVLRDTINEAQEAGQTRTIFEGHSEPLQVLQKRLEILIATRDRLSESMEKKQSDLTGEGMTADGTKAYQQLAASVDYLKERLGMLQDASDELADAMEQDGEATETWGGSVLRAISEAEGFTGKLGVIISAAHEFNSAIVSGVANAVKTVASAVSTATSHIVNFGKSVAHINIAAVKASFNAIKKGASAATGAVKRLGSALGSAVMNLKLFNKSGKSSQNVTKSIMRAMMRLAGIRNIFSFIRKSMGPAIEGLAKYSSQFNSSMASMKNAGTELTANLAVSFGNLINAVAPVITQIINWISTLISYLNGFFAMLSGKNSITQAKKATDAYGKSAGGASKKAKELKKQLMGFDEINNLNKDDDSNGGGGGGSSGPGFEEVKLDKLLPKEIQAYFQKIKDAIMSQDWEEVGGLIADGLNVAVAKIDEGINAIHGKVVEWSSNIARALNGLVSRVDFPLIGKTVGDGLNLIIDAENTFLETFNTKALGAGLGDAINSLFATINWDEVGRNFALKINAFLSVLDGFFEQFDARTAGADLGKMVNSMFDNIKWTGDGGVADVFSGGINSVIEALDGFLVTLEDGGEERRKKFGDAIYDMVTGVNWVQAIVTLNRGIQLIANWFTVAFASLAKAIADSAPDIVTKLNELVQESDFETIKTNITNGFNNVIKAFNELVGGEGSESGGIDLGGIREKLTQAVNGIITETDFDVAVQAVGVGIGKIFAEFSQFLADVEWKKVAAKFALGLNKFLHSEEINWGDVGKNLGTAFKEQVEALATFLEDVDWHQLGVNIAEFLMNIPWGEIAAALWGAFKAALMGAFNLVQGFTEALSHIDVDDSGAIQERFRAYGVEVTKEFAEGMKGATETEIATAANALFLQSQNIIGGMDEAAILALHEARLAGEVDEYYRDIATNIEGVGEEAGTKVGSTMTEATGTGMKQGMENAKAEVEAETEELANVAGMSGQKTNIETDSKAAGGAVGDSSVEGMQSKEESVKTEAEKIVENITGPLENLEPEQKKQAEAMMAAIELAIKNGTPQAEETTKAAADAIVEKVAGIMTSTKGEEIANTFMGGITTGIQNQQTSIYNDMATVGTYITAGMAHGIYSNTSVVINAAKNAALAAYRAACRYLGISSPSKVFSEVGKFTMLGWAEGEEDNMSAVLDTIANTSKAMQDEAQDTEINVGTDTLVNGLDTAMDRLQSIADVFSSIGEMLADIGELPVPEMATGSVIPYRTRVSDGAMDTQVTMPTNTLTTDNSYEPMYRAFRDALQSVQDERPIEVVVNGRRLTDLIDRVRRESERSRGV